MEKLVNLLDTMRYWEGVSEWRMFEVRYEGSD